MSGALIVGNLVICNKIVNKVSIRAVIFLNINQKGLGFLGCAGDVASVAIGPMSVGSRDISQTISYHQKTALGAWLEASQKFALPAKE